NYPVVSAASIIAKVEREKEIEKIRKQYEEYGELGSGYPADPITKKFLEKNWKKHPEIFRKSWTSWKRLAQKNNQTTFDSFK
ncbi:MAG: ribonuclease HII, partial [Nanoarchaeota archaeon]